MSIDAAETSPEDADLTASAVRWDIETLLDGQDIDALLDRADELAGRLEQYRRRVGELSAAELAEHMHLSADLQELLGRAGSYASLRFAVDTTDPAHGALMQRVDERATAVSTRLLFFELEWVALDDDHVATLLRDPDLEFCGHYLRSLRRYQPHVLSEPEERILTEKSVTGANAWVRLFSELTSAITVDLPDAAGAPLEAGLSLLADPNHSVRKTAAQAVTDALEPGLRTRAYVFNTIAADKAIDDRLRTYPSWISARNLANEASDESVEALVDAVVGRYEIARRWYRLKARILGVDRIADYDRMASLAESTQEIGWAEGSEIVLDAYRSFSPTLADGATRFMDERLSLIHI